MYPEDVVFLIPITAIIMGIALVIFVLYLSYRRHSEALRFAHLERLAAIQKGIELPPATPSSRLEVELRELPSRRRTAGLTLLFVGAAITVAMWGSDSPAYWWGLVPMAIGVAQILASLLDRGLATPRPRPPAP
jgi:hypothetical protein